MCKYLRVHVLCVKTSMQGKIAVTAGDNLTLAIGGHLESVVVVDVDVVVVTRLRGLVVFVFVIR